MLPLAYSCGVLAQIPSVVDDIYADIGGAKSAGMNAVLVKTGKFNENLLSNSKIQPDYVIKSIADLPRIFGII